MAVYRPQLSTLMNLCEVNYMMLLRLLADKEQAGDVRQYFISDFLSYTIVVDEVTRYTSLITMRQDATIAEHHLSEYFSPKMVIRLYHDARMAEVISNQDIRYIKPRYDYPNQSMHLPDEKQQINEFLKEWLQLSLQLGQTKVQYV
ncbi:DUF1249 domain-containing protein [Thalassotalea sp. G2M2-11]|uniref:DUF1249 domain-containing protein n=1 Tax=Thalassotalea sp. G2M2-11 TaxID=2787627 RepID=UPI0019D0C903|nr:DUF1249 domain-containing protein [Thalassotalea sp. G2M2-11]